jgi:catechol 2,3-dioxygenase-like lactoylglutathione lyase family enzyme
MSVSGLKVVPTIAVSEMATAKEFYEGKLGLSDGREQPDGGTIYPSGEGSSIHIYPSPDNAGKSGATLAAWQTDDVEKVVDQLTASGVAFERYDTDALKTDEKGIAHLGEAQIAWFKDPDGNILAIETP